MTQWIHNMAKVLKVVIWTIGWQYDMMLMVFVKKILYDYTEKHLTMDKWLNRSSFKLLQFTVLKLKLISREVKHMIQVLWHKKQKFWFGCKLKFFKAQKHFAHLVTFSLHGGAIKYQMFFIGSRFKGLWTLFVLIYESSVGVVEKVLEWNIQT